MAGRSYFSSSPLGMGACLLAVFLLGGQALPASAQDLDPPATIEPATLHFGTVRQGAIVKGSVRLSIVGNSVLGLKGQVEAPDFLTVLDKRRGVIASLAVPSKQYNEVTISLNTSQLGDKAGLLRLKLGDRQVSVHTTVTVATRESGASRVLIVEFPLVRFAKPEDPTFGSWKQIVEGGNLDVSYLEVGDDGAVLPDVELSNYDVVLLSGRGVVRITGNDITRLQEFIWQGGRVVIAASAFLNGTVGNANRILKECGIKIQGAGKMGETLFERGKAVFTDEFTADVNTLRVDRLTPVVVTDLAKAEFLVTGARPGQALAARGRSGKGEVIALGVVQWWAWITPEIGEQADNAQFLRNLLTKSDNN